MSSTLEDIAYDEYLDQAWEAEEALRDDAVLEYKQKCLRSYFIKNPDVLIPAKTAVERGKELLKKGYVTPALVFSFTGIELMLNKLILKPLFYGTMLDSEIADFISEDFFRTRRETAKNEKMIKFFIKRFCDIDINDYRKKDLWARITELRILRNQVVHEGAVVTKKDAELVITTARDVYEISESIINHIGLKIDKKTWSVEE